MIEISRSSYRYRPVEQPENDRLRVLLRGFAEREPTDGYRLAWSYLRRKGHEVNHTRVQRLWR
ncbi:MAG: IS3 family transposase, partial [Anaerolineae bacterium]|nr:IS3 family transposase [Anaerolineae bacterium]